MLSVAALTVFDSVGHALLIPLSYLAINIVQGQFVSPILLGHRLALNPVALFVGLAFWFWVWGIPGAFIAVPLVATFKIFCDNIEVLAFIGEFLGQTGRGRAAGVGAVAAPAAALCVAHDVKQNESVRRVAALEPHLVRAVPGKFHEEVAVEPNARRRRARPPSPWQPGIPPG